MFFFNYTATTEIYTLSLHDALPISQLSHLERVAGHPAHDDADRAAPQRQAGVELAEVRIARHVVLDRSEEHTSELQSRQYLACRLLLEKKTRHQLHDSSWLPVAV